MEHDIILRKMEALCKGKIAVAGNIGQGAEGQYGQLYQQLVRAGRAPQLREKYRG